MIRKFEFIETELKGSFLIHPFYASDERGGFIKDYNIDIFRENSINHKLKEVFNTVSKQGVLRATHFQNPKQQAKLIRCIKGQIYDVIVDLRKNSPTLGQWLGFELSEENMNCLYVPRYFGHGYLVLQDSIVSYQCDEVFYGEFDSGIMYNDPDIGINWPYDKIGGFEKLIISEKDLQLQSFKNYCRSFDT